MNCIKKFANNRCRFCKKVFCCKDCRFNHEVKKHEVLCDCDICVYGNIRFRDATNILNHIKASHWPLHCVFCKKVFSKIQLCDSKCLAMSNKLKLTMLDTPIKPLVDDEEDRYDSPPIGAANENFSLNIATSTPLPRVGDVIESMCQDISKAITPVEHSNLKLKVETDSCTKNDQIKLKRRVTFCEQSITDNEESRASYKYDQNSEVKRLVGIMTNTKSSKNVSQDSERTSKTDDVASFYYSFDNEKLKNVESEKDKNLLQQKAKCNEDHDDEKENKASANEQLTSISAVILEKKDDNSETENEEKSIYFSFLFDTQDSAHGESSGLEENISDEAQNDKEVEIAHNPHIENGLTLGNDNAENQTEPLGTFIESDHQNTCNKSQQSLQIENTLEKEMIFNDGLEFVERIKIPNQMPTKNDENNIEVNDEVVQNMSNQLKPQISTRTVSVDETLKESVTNFSKDIIEKYEPGDSHSIACSSKCVNHDKPTMSTMLEDVKSNSPEFSIDLSNVDSEEVFPANEENAKMHQEYISSTTVCNVKEKDEKCRNKWSSITSLMLSLVGLGDKVKKRKRNFSENDHLVEEPDMKRSKGWDFKCRPPIRDVGTIIYLRVDKPKKVDKWTQTDDTLYY